MFPRPIFDVAETLEKNIDLVNNSPSYHVAKPVPSMTNRLFGIADPGPSGGFAHLDSEKCTIGGQRCLAARIRMWNLPESSFWPPMVHFSESNTI